MTVLGSMGSRPAPPSGGGGAPTSTVIWSVDFADELDHDFKTTATQTISGVTWTAVNATGCTEFRIDGGLLIIQGGQAGSYYNGTYTSPALSARISDLCTAKGATGSFDVTKEYVFRMVLGASSPTISTAGEGIALGFRESIGDHIGDCVKFGNYAEYYTVYRGGLTWFENLAQSAFNAIVPTATARSYAVAFYQKTFRCLVSPNDESGNAFGGKVPMGGMCAQYNAPKSIIESPTATGTMDLSATAADCFLAAYTKASGNTRWQIETLELHEVAK